MTDLHLNLFCPYNQDYQLIENNLTRALILTLRYLSGPSRNIFLHRLLDDKASTNIDKNALNGISFSDAEFALQEYMDLDISRSAIQKSLITISSYRYEMPNEIEVNPYPSKPDGWIFDPDGQYCILIESKIGENPISDPQIISHAAKWFEIDQMDLRKHLISLTWNVVVACVQDILSLITSRGGHELSTQEECLLHDFEGYLNLFGYGKYAGLNFERLCKTPNFQLTDQDIYFDHIFRFLGLAEPPKLRLGLSS